MKTNLAYILTVLMLIGSLVQAKGPGTIGSVGGDPIAAEMAQMEQSLAQSVSTKIIVKYIIDKKLVSKEDAKFLKNGLASERLKFLPMTCEIALGTAMCAIRVENYLSDPNDMSDLSEITFRSYQGNITEVKFELLAG